jgi:2-oxoglutarate dehydrogenase E2 component (dihydrolipoamide succinyltransferase)
MADVTMPQLGETVTEGTITRWTKSVGDAVSADEVLFEVSTDKVDSEVPAPAGGVLAEILVQEGETADVGAVLARISDGGEAPAPASAETNGPGTSEPAPDAAATAPLDESPATAAFPPVSQPTITHTVGPRSAPEPAPAPAAAAPAPAASSDGPGFGGRVLSPVVRKLISENGLDANTITGTGAGGRITREDVEKLIAGGAAQPASTSAAPVAASYAPAAAPRQATPAPLPPAQAGDRDLVVPFTKIRQRTAEHMIMSKATSAHTLVTIEVDYANVDKVRKAKKDQFKQEEGASLTYLPFISRAVVDALRDFPYANASVGTNELIVHRDVNLGIAVDLDFEGLLVPVLRNADGLRLRQLGRGIADIAYRARNKKLQADDIAGGTFTITNAGGYGTFITYPVINQPQVAILSTDGVKKRPVVVELPDGTDAIVAHPVGMLGLAWDHRAFDGAYASAFLAKIKEVLETRNWAEEF